MIPVSIGTVSLDRVQSVSPASEVATAAFTTSAGAGAVQKSVEIHGFILGTPESLMIDSQALVNALIAEGDCAVVITGMDDFEGRVKSVKWDQYNTGSLWRYTITVEPATNTNPFLGTISVGGLTLNNPTPAVSEGWSAPNEDDPLDQTHQRSFEISGTYRGTPVEIQAFVEALEDAVTTDASANDGYLTLVTPMGTYEARCTRKNVRRPSGVDSVVPVTYSLTFETRKDFTLEPHQMGHQQVSVGGILWDVVTSFSHSQQSQQIGVSALRKITGESMSWSLKKWFTSVAAADSFKTTLDALVSNGDTMSSPSGTLLRLVSISYNTPTRDGNAGDDERRYSLTASVTYSKDTSSRINPGGIHFGIQFDQVSSVNESVSIDEHGVVTSRSKTVSGKVTSYPTGLLGSASSEVDGKTYYITSQNGGAIDDEGLFTLSLSGKTLESQEQALDIVDGMFSGLFFNEITSQSRSVSHTEIEGTGALEPTSLSESISGYVWGGNRNLILNLVQVVNGTLGSEIITSVNVGKRERYTRPDTLESSYRESVSLTRVTSYDTTEPPEDPEEEEAEDEAQQNRESQPDVKEETSLTVEENVPQWRPVTIAGRGIIMKLVGVNPKKATVRVTRTAKNWIVWESMSAPPAPSSPIGGGEVSSDRSGEDGLSKWVEKSWILGE